MSPGFPKSHAPHKRENISNDTNLSGPFALLGRRHDLVVGTSNRSEVFDGHGGRTDTAFNVDPYNWDRNAIAKPDIGMSLWSLKFESEQKAIYAATRLSLSDPLTDSRWAPGLVRP